MSISKWRYTEECNGRPCPGDCDHCSFKPGDLISRADAIEAVRNVARDLIQDRCMPLGCATDFTDALSALPSANVIEFDFNKYQPRVRNKVNDGTPSADANPTVVRCKTMIPYGDFREWAKRIREDNPNVIVIPFDAEVASADAVHKPDYSYEADMVRRLKELLSAEAEDRLYIKIYADDEPSVKAEKLYQICDGTQNREVAKWLKEYFPSAEAVQGEWIFNTDENNGKSWNICSVCGYSIFHTTNYCPSCGAIMKGGDTE